MERPSYSRIAGISNKSACAKPSTLAWPRRPMPTHAQKRRSLPILPDRIDKLEMARPIGARGILKAPPRLRLLDDPALASLRQGSDVRLKEKPPRATYEQPGPKERIQVQKKGGSTLALI